MQRLTIATLLFLPSISAFSAELLRTAPEATYTLYSSSMLFYNADDRNHIATFDTNGGATYNRSQCERAKTLFKSQMYTTLDGIEITYWCERGYFSKK